MDSGFYEQYFNMAYNLAKNAPEELKSLKKKMKNIKVISVALSDGEIKFSNEVLQDRLKSFNSLHEYNKGIEPKK